MESGSAAVDGASCGVESAVFFTEMSSAGVGSVVAAMAVVLGRETVVVVNLLKGICVVKAEKGRSRVDAGTEDQLSLR